jgi:PhnB protein
MATVNAYLTFNGNAEEAFNFYKSVFKREFDYIGRFKDMPADENFPPLSEEEGNRIMHISLPISKETFLMASDTNSFSGDVTFGNNISVSINTDSAAEADTLFAGLSAGGNIIMPMEKTFWGAYFGMFTDKFGINWMINFDETPNQQ